jgi:DnaJ-class molecular chaperone
MKKDRLPEIVCPSCDGTGIQNVKQPDQPERRIYPPPCKECLGKGRVALPLPLKGKGVGGRLARDKSLTHH